MSLMFLPEGDGPFVMVAGGAGGPQFLSLSPSEYPLPSCLSVTKREINIGDAHRYNPAIFQSKGKSV